MEAVTLYERELDGAAPGLVSGVLQRALNDERVFVFGELLAHPKVVELRSKGGDPWINVTELFAYGTFADYRARRGALPELNETLVRKLKQLTVVSLAARAHVLPYGELQAALEVETVAEVEELVVACIYAGLLDARLDQRAQRVDIHSAAGRDVRLEELGSMIGALRRWADTTKSLMHALEDKKSSAVVSRFAREEKVVKLARDVARARAKGEDEARASRGHAGHGGHRGHGILGADALDFGVGALEDIFAGGSDARRVKRRGGGMGGGLGRP